MKKTCSTFVINMKRNPERLAFMTKQLNNAGIAFSVQEGYDGATFDFSQDFDERAYVNLHAAPMSKSEQGCALSHKQALQRLLESDSDFALIMEDDVSLPAHFKKIIDQEIAQRTSSKTSWDYLSFNYPSVGMSAILLWFFLFSTKFRTSPGFKKYITLPIYVAKFFAFSSFSLAEKLRELLYAHLYTYGAPARFLRPLYLAGCYLVTKEGARKLLKTQGEKLLYTADRLPNAARIKNNLAFFAFVPLVVKQNRDLFQSENVDNAFNDRVKNFMGGRLLRE